MKIYHIIYKITNLINNKIYIGAHSTDNLNDSYLGSGKLLYKAFKKYGKENFKKEILDFFESTEEMYLAESKIVNEDFVKRRDTYNLTIGGNGGGYHNRDKIVVYDKNNNTLQVSINDPRYLSGELIHILTNKIIVTDGKTNFAVLKNDSRYLSGELKSVHIGKTIMKNKETDEYIFTDDLLNEKYVGIQKGKVTVKDILGNITSVSKNDPRYLSGELVHAHKNMVSVRDENNNIFKINCNDMRYINGDLNFVFSDCKWIHNEDTQKLIHKSLIEDYIENGWKFGMLNAPCKGLICIYKDNNERKIKPKEKQLFLKQGWKLGRLKGRTCINNKKEEKRVLNYELNDYLTKGWEIGRLNLKRKIINNGKTELRIPENELNNYLENGWKLGRKKFKRSCWKKNG